MKFKSNLLVLLALAFAAVFSVGCGASSNTNESQFVYTGPSAAASSVGTLVFQFTNPQAVSVSVPTNTTTLRFDVYSGQNGGGTLVFTQSAAYANQITLTGVPTTAQSVVITAFNSAGFPIGVLTQDVTVTADATTNVDLSKAAFTKVTVTALTATPDTLTLDVGATGSYTITATFSNGVTASIPASAATYTLANTTLATVSNAGVFTGAAAGTTTVAIKYNHNGTDSSVTKNLTVNAVNNT